MENQIFTMKTEIYKVSGTLKMDLGMGYKKTILVMVNYLTKKKG